jgi:hypothetical protein
MATYGRQLIKNISTFTFNSSNTPQAIQGPQEGLITILNITGNFTAAPAAAAFFVLYQSYNFNTATWITQTTPYSYGGVINAFDPFIFTRATNTAPEVVNSGYAQPSAGNNALILMNEFHRINIVPTGITSTGVCNVRVSYLLEK